MKVIKSETSIKEFNSKILDTLITKHQLPIQQADEFSIPDLRKRGWTREAARVLCDREMKSGKYTKRLGRSATTGRVCWLYRKKKKYASDE